MNMLNTYRANEHAESNNSQPMHDQYFCIISIDYYYRIIILIKLKNKYLFIKNKKCKNLFCCLLRTIFEKLLMTITTVIWELETIKKL